MSKTDMVPNNGTNDSADDERSTVEPTLGYDLLMKQHFEYKLSLDLYVYVIPVLVILGCTGNCLSFLVTRRSRMRHLPICVTISVLSFADSGVLIFSAVRFWIGKVTGYDLKMISNVLCKIFGGFVFHFVRHYASWLVVMIAATRTVVVFMPLKTSTFTLLRVTKISCFVIGVILACIDASLFWIYELIHDPIEVQGEIVYQKRCFIRGQMRFRWPWIDLVLYSLLPMILLTAFSIALSIKAILALRNRMKLFEVPVLPSAEVASTSNGPNTLIRVNLPPPETVEIDLAVKGPQCLDIPQRKTPNVSPGSSRVHPLQDNDVIRTVEKKSQSSDWRQSMMPIIISIFFIFTTGGITGMEIVYSDITDRDPKTMARIRLARTCLFLLMYCNHSLNIVLYILSGRNFRVETLALLRRR